MKLLNLSFSNILLLLINVYLLIFLLLFIYFLRKNKISENFIFLLLKRDPGKSAFHDFKLIALLFMI